MYRIRPSLSSPLTDLLLALVLAAAAAPAAMGDWTTGGPYRYGGGVSLPAIDPVTPTTLYATWTAGLYKSTDSGKTWSFLGELGVPVIDPLHPSTLYAGSNPTRFGSLSSIGVFKSTDGGATWKAPSAGLPANASVTALAIDPSNPSTLYAGGSGVFKSTDAGTTWAELLAPGLQVNTIVVDPSAPLTVYVACSGESFYHPHVALLKTVDGGASWHPAESGISPLFVFSLAIDPVIPSTLYAGNVYGVFKSTDGGASWVKSRDTCCGFYVFNLAVDPLSPSTVYAGGTYFSQPREDANRLLKSTDAGATWFLACPADARGVRFDPVTPSIVYAAAASGLYRSTDSGASWAGPYIAGVTSGLQTNAIAVSPGTPATVWAGTATGVFASTDSGASWSAMNLGPAARDIRALAADPFSPSTIYAGAFGVGVYRSTDTGRTWSGPGSGLGTGQVISLAVDRSSPSTLYAGDRGAGVFKSTDSGATWSASGLLGTFVNSIAVDPLAPSTVYAGTETRSVMKTTDGGGGWTPLNIGSTKAVHVVALDPVRPSTVYAGLLNGGVLRSFDGGASWGLVGLAGISVWALAIDPAAPSSIIAATDYGVYESADSGSTWTLSLSRPTAISVAVDPSGTVYAGFYADGVWQRPGGPSIFALSLGRVQVTVEWRSHYSGTAGAAVAIPQQNAWGYFYFTDPTNPEVFVKVLDFGAGSALCFVGGLTDFYYKVTFTMLRTGQTLVFEKPAYQYHGFVDATTLKFAGAPGAPAESVRSSGGMTFVGALATDEAASGSKARPVGMTNSAIAQPLAEAPQSLAFSSGRVAVTVDWRNPYSGDSGRAYGIPKADQFGFFYYTDPSDPEVFVKVLDFGGGIALVFVGGLTDFYYKVTFTVLRTGQQLVFEKPEKQYVGFVDATTLRF